MSVFGASILCAQLLAQDQKPSPRKTPAAAITLSSVTAGRHGAELTASDLQALLDGFMPQQIELPDIAGAVVPVVQDGKVLLRRGHGHSDVDKQTPVSRQATPF